MIDYQSMVEEFHDTFGITNSDAPTNIDRSAFARRVRLISEELSEYCKAVSADDIVEIADALGDLLYVTFGACIEHGLPMQSIFKEIHKSNMTKVGGHKDDSGKWVKPDTYVPVDLNYLRDWRAENDNKTNIFTGINSPQGGD